MILSKEMKAQHDQKTINHLNRELEKVDKALSGAIMFQETVLLRKKNQILNRLAKLYGTRKYGLITPN